jgi:hypothetical protein
MDRVAVCVQALTECAGECTARADSCLDSSDFADLVDCCGAALRCADICHTTIWAVSRYTHQHASLHRALLLACITACRDAREQCTNHVNRHSRRRSCAQASRRAEQACLELLLQGPT